MGSGTDENLVRLSKLMAEKGLCSRREADAFIEKGLVYVNGVQIKTLGTKVSPDVSISLETSALESQNKLATIIVNKPVGYVSSQPEKGYEPAVVLITQPNQVDGQKRKLRESDFEGLAVAGRLDIDSQGLLIFTQDGRLARKIIGENSEVEKEYLVRYRGPVTKEKLKLLSHGLELDGKKLKPAKVEILNEDQLKIVLKEGKKRQIRRMLELVDLRVVGLKRVRVGNLRLGNLPEGQWRFLERDEKI